MNWMKTSLLGCLLLALAGCHTDMWYQAKVTSNDEDESGIFKDGASNRPLPKGAVAQGWAKTDDGFSTGYQNGKLVTQFPTMLTLDGEKVNTIQSMEKVLKRGKERFTIACSHCHGAAGDGKGMITQRGLVLKRVPPTYHTDRLRKMPIGYFYDVITNGYGIMHSQASRVLPDDRWAITAYIRALQLSQDAKPSDLDANDMKALEEAKAPKVEGAAEGSH